MVERKPLDIGLRQPVEELADEQDGHVPPRSTSATGGGRYFFNPAKRGRSRGDRPTFGRRREHILDFEASGCPGFFPGLDPDKVEMGKKQRLIAEAGGGMCGPARPIHEPR